MACFRCFNRKWLIVWQIFDRTYTEEKPLHVQAMQQKLVCLKHHKMACLRCFKGKWLLLWQMFDRTHTEEKPIHVQAMQQKLVCLKHHKNGIF